MTKSAIWQKAIETAKEELRQAERTDKACEKGVDSMSEEKRQSMYGYQFIRKTGVPVEKALTPEQCKIMRRFLAALSKAHEINPGLDVGWFISEYRQIINGYRRKKNVANG